MLHFGPGGGVKPIVSAQYALGGFGQRTLMSSLKEPISVASVYGEGACKVNYGRVVISASPAPSFSFRSDASWPAESYESYVRLGILEGLACAGLGSDFGAVFVLQEVGWDDVESCGDGYYNAAKQATEQIIRDAAPLD